MRFFLVWLPDMGCAQEREDARRNILQVAGRKVRERASMVYSAAGGSTIWKEIVSDESYRDRGGERMADERFQQCMMTWYFSIRRLPTKHLVDDLSKLEFSVTELAYVDMEVGSCIELVASYFLEKVIGHMR